VIEESGLPRTLIAEDANLSRATLGSTDTADVERVSHRPDLLMTTSDQLPSVAAALRIDVERSASGAKRLKLRTRLAKFGYIKRSDSNTAEITRLLGEAGLAMNPPIVRFGDSWVITQEDWIYLSLLGADEQPAGRLVSEEPASRHRSM
jgi:hypothetical protein